MGANMNIAARVERQRVFFRSGATRPVEFRRAQLQRLADAIQAHETGLSEALHADLRRSALDAYSAEIGFVLSEIRFALRHLDRWMKPRRVSAPLAVWPAKATVQPEPFGVSLIIGPWNYPVQLALLPLVGAMAAGNCAIIKPSELAPRTSAVLAQLINSTFAAEYLTAVEGDREIAEALLRERFDFIFFTGSTNVGRAVLAAAARHLTPTALELGGKCPCIVCADAPVEVTARRIAWGKFINAGQTCVAPDFILVDRRVRSELTEALARVIAGFYGTDPQKSPDYGRIINTRHLERLTGYLKQGRIAMGGQYDAKDLYLAPTLLEDVKPDAPVMQEEIFGPILPIMEFDTLDDALDLLGDKPTPLALYLFTNDRRVQARVLATARSGGVCLNDAILHLMGRNLPFGGLGDSGLGAYHGKASFDCFTHRRSVLTRSFVVDPPMRYPPPRVSLATMKRLYRYLLGA
jgi:aldehyde dehydrogenase (NAD+)